MSFLELLIVLVIVLLITKPLGTHLYKVLNYDKTFINGFFDRVESFIYNICGIDEDEKMNWKRYASVFVFMNLFMIVTAFIFLLVQSYISLGFHSAGNMRIDLAFNTAISFMTNTNLQHYAGETDITFVSQMLVIVFLMFTSAASGIATAAAIIRGIAKQTDNLGNFYMDFVRVIIRVLLPLSFILALILMWQGVPQSFSGNLTYNTVQGASQTIVRGPVAVLEAIKHIGTNGGGFFTANSAHPFENPTPFTNVLEIISMMAIPSSLLYTFGLMIKDRKHTWIIYGALSFIFILVTIGVMQAEIHPQIYSQFHVAAMMGNMEGKEVRFGAADSALFSSVTTAFTTGSVNSMHDSFTPLGGAVPMVLMMLNTIFGGAGAGLENIIMYSILTVFITGLMVGRTPEYQGKKIETREVKLVALSILIHPLLILFATALTLLTQTGVSTSPGYHGLSQIIYEFTSASANNGSEFAGIIGSSPYMNVLTGLIMFIGRYLPIVLLLAVGGSMAAKKKLEPSPGTFRTDNVLFGALLIGIIIIVGALTFFPVIVLGPVSEFLSLI